MKTLVIVSTEEGSVSVIAASREGDMEAPPWFQDARSQIHRSGFPRSARWVGGRRAWDRDGWKLPSAAWRQIGTEHCCGISLYQ